eukprot:2953738-Pleurochrysis_carterae.AAC.6
MVCGIACSTTQACQSTHKRARGGHVKREHCALTGNVCCSFHDNAGIISPTGRSICEPKPPSSSLNDSNRCPHSAPRFGCERARARTRGVVQQQGGHRWPGKAAGRTRPPLQTDKGSSFRMMQTGEAHGKRRFCRSLCESVCSSPLPWAAPIDARSLAELADRCRVAS